MFHRLETILTGCAQIFFLQGSVAGGLLIAITCLFPQLALPGIIAVVSAYCFACLIGIEPKFNESGYYTYNPLLAGLSVGYLCRISPPALLLAVLAGVLALLITAVLVRVLVTGTWLPVLSLPFALTACLVWLVAARYAGTAGGDARPAAADRRPRLCRCGWRACSNRSAPCCSPRPWCRASCWPCSSSAIRGSSSCWEWAGITWGPCCGPCSSDRSRRR